MPMPTINFVWVGRPRLDKGAKEVIGPVFLYHNLKKPSVAALVVQQTITAKDFAFLTHQEICPEKWKQLIEDKKVRDKQKYEPNIEASTDNFTCNKCKSKKCTYYQLQTRSADEPMTTFVTCLECGKRWKC
jgi:transcription elongation factor S-II